MTMKQCKPGVVRREINLNFLIAAEHHDIFHNARSHLAAYLSQLETVAMQMDRMNIVTCVLHAKTVTPAFLHRPHGLHVLLGKRDIIDRPQVEAILSGILLGKLHLEDLVRFWARGCAAKVGIVPAKRFWRNPLRLAFLPGIFDHDTQAVMAIVVRQITHNPNPRMIHLHDGRDPFSCAQPESRDLCGLWNYISVQGNNREGVSGQRQAANFGGASIQDMEQHPLSSFYPYRLAMAQHPPVDGERTVPNFVPMRRALCQRGLHGAFSRIFQVFYYRCRGQEIHCHITATAECGLKFLQGQEDFAIVITRIVLRFDVYGATSPLYCPTLRSAFARTWV